MNILSINPFKIINTNNTVSYNTQPRFGLTMPKPLTQDTVSFGSLGASKFIESQTAGVSKRTAIKIHKMAAEVQPEIDRFMMGIFSDYIVSKEKPNNLIASIKGRPKSPDSILEKSKSLEENTVAGMLKKATDINGEKIVMLLGDRKNTHKILDILLENIKRGFLILEEVEVKRPAAAKKLKGADVEQWDYAEPEVLQKFVSEAEKTMGRKVNYPEPDLTPANYSALHFLLRLPGQKGVFELQLMGGSVAEFKNLDDILYKILNNKNVEKKYKPIVDILKPIIMSPEDKLFQKYIKIRDKINKLKMSSSEYEKLLERIIEGHGLVEKSDPASYINKILSLSRAKDITECDLDILVDRSDFELNYIDSEYMNQFKSKIERHEKFKAYRAQAFLFQREKKTASGDGRREYFLPLSVDLPEEYDLNNLYTLFLKAKA